MPGFNIYGEGASSSPDALVEAGRLHRWRVDFKGGERFALYAHSCQRPSPEFSIIIIHHGINEIKMPGKYKWSPVTIKFYEIGDEVNMTARAIFKLWSGGLSGNVLDIRKQHIVKQFYNELKVTMEDGAGGNYWEYTLYRAWPSKVDPTELTYTSSDIATVSVTFNYDAADEARGGNARI